MPEPAAVHTADDAATILDGVSDTADQTQEKPQDWPEDWRERAAGGDDKLLKRFSRYAAPGDAFKALTEAQNRIAAGLKPAPLAADATPEDVAAWRNDNGIPEKPGDYDLTLPGGYVIGEADKPVIDEFLQHAHTANMRPEQVQGALSWYYETQEKQAQALAEADARTFSDTEDALRQEWGTDYRRNVNLAASILDAAPAGVKENMLGARLADGTALGNNPDVLRWLTTMAREINPLATVVPGSGATATAALDNEIATIEARMGGDAATRAAYFKDDKAQARYRELIAVRDKAQR